MSHLQQQILELEHKVDGLHEIVERLSVQIAGLVQQKVHGPELVVAASEEDSQHHPSPKKHHPESPFRQHKDILWDEEEWGAHHGHGHLSEVSLSPELQIRRLTAQLTAAYNRIAALEEQLLSHRIPS